jgi:hypothetical protein
MYHALGVKETDIKVWLEGINGRQRCRWEDNIKMDLRDIDYQDAEWTYLAEERVQWWILWTWNEPLSSTDEMNLLTS